MSDCNKFLPNIEDRYSGLKIHNPNIQLNENQKKLFDSLETISQNSDQISSCIKEISALNGKIADLQRQNNEIEDKISKKDWQVALIGSVFGAIGSLIVYIIQRLVLNF